MRNVTPRTVPRQPRAASARSTSGRPATRAPMSRSTSAAKPRRSQKLSRQLAKSAHKAIVLKKATTPAQPLQRSKRYTPKDSQVRTPSRRRPRQLIWGALSCILVAVTGYMVYDVWQTNARLKNDLSVAASALGKPDAAARQRNEGKDHSKVPVSAIDSYVVAPSLPRVISIDKLGVKARVLPMSTNPDNSMQAPINIHDAGWYMASAKPGEPGAAVIDGHYGLGNAGLFARLSELVPGDTITIEKGDRDVLTYQVIKTERVPLNDVDMDKLLVPYDNVPQGLNLITCIGQYEREKETYDHREIIYTKRVE